MTAGNILHAEQRWLFLKLPAAPQLWVGDI